MRQIRTAVWAGNDDFKDAMARADAEDEEDTGDLLEALAGFGVRLVE